MFEYQVISTLPLYTIYASPFPRLLNLSDTVKGVVEKIWKQESALPNRYLFNGQILSLVSQEGAILKGEFVEYKHYLAQMRDPSLQPILQISPLSVSGITLANKDFVLVGRRSENVTQNPNFYELVPSGGIDPNSIKDDKIDIDRQFLLELEEEAGIAASAVISIEPFGLIYEKMSQTYELCAEIRVDKDLEEKLLSPKKEYSHLLWLQKEELENFIKEQKSNFLPMSQMLLKMREFL